MFIEESPETMPMSADDDNANWIAMVSSSPTAVPDQSEWIDIELPLLIDTSAPVWPQAHCSRIMTTFMPNQDACIDVFFTCFCTEMGMLPSTLAWKQILPSIMASAPGVRDAVCAVGGLYAHRLENRKGLAADAMGYYSASVQAVQRSLSADTSNSNMTPSSDTMSGVAILMLFELVHGNRAGYAAHVNALAAMLKQLGPHRCRTGINALLFSSILKPETDSALIAGRDTFLADEAWLGLAREQFPAAVSKLCRLFATAARVMSRETRFQERILACYAEGKALPSDLPFARQENEEKAKACLETLKGCLATLEGMKLFVGSTEDAAWPQLSRSPFLPSIRAKDVRLTGFFPMVVALIVKLEACFALRNQNTTTLVRKCIMLSQDVICRRLELGVVVRQITPLAMISPFLVEAREKAWVRELWDILSEQGLAIISSGISTRQLADVDHA
jgi:hypothetical protein